MTYATLMLHLKLGSSNAGLLQIAGDLARRFDAGVIGIAACQPLQILGGEGYVSGDLFEEDRKEMKKELAAAEAEFRSALHAGSRKLEWRSSTNYGSLADYIAGEARSADLLITGVDPADYFNASRRVNTGDLVMQAGRPVLIVPTGADSLSLQRVLVGWKETRESRRAVVDALPLLKRAAHVVVAEIAAGEALDEARAHVADVVAWLARHNVAAEGLASPSTSDDPSGLYAIAQDHAADVIVAGAYGHSRLREWVLGGVTRDLLIGGNRCSFLSH